MNALDLGVCDIFVSMFMDATVRVRPSSVAPDGDPNAPAEDPEEAQHSSIVQIACKCIAEIAAHKKLIKVRPQAALSPPPRDGTERGLRLPCAVLPACASCKPASQLLLGTCSFSHALAPYSHAAPLPPLMRRDQAWEQSIGEADTRESSVAYAAQVVHVCVC